MPTGLEFGIYQCIVYDNLVPSSIRGGEGNALDLRLEIFEQFVHQANGPVGVTSDCAINDGDF